MSESEPINVNVKWSKENLPVEIDPSEPPAVFMSQLWTLTGVPPERQTILGLKGGKLKDSAQWSDLNLRPNMKLILMGTPDSARLAPPPNVPKVTDDLDLDKSSAAARAAAMAPAGPPGLVNLGNTCYMNATVQCLHAVAPLSDALTQFKGTSAALNPAEKLTASLRDVFSRLRSRNTPSVNPAAFLGVLRQINPQFAERGQNGFFMQQDAEECWGELLTRLATALATPTTTSSASPSPSPTAPASSSSSSSSSAKNRIDELFSIEMRGQDKCDETNEVIERGESVRALKCHISNQVSHVNQGIKEGLTETIEKTSEQLGRSAKWHRTSQIQTLPPFLVVQFVRFFWKPAEAVKAKILRRVAFPVDLDVFDFCTDELKTRLTTKRDAAQAAADKRLDEARADPNGKKSDQPKNEASAASAGSATAAGAGANGQVVITQAETGRYELCAVLTHKGRAADSGHYVAWVKGTDEKWYQFDDDKVSIHTEEEVKKLCGGGDWHMAYMCLYRAKNTM